MSERENQQAVELQNAGWADLDQVMEVMTAAFDPKFGEGWTRAQCAGILPMSGVKMTLAHADSAPLGFSLARHVAGESELLLLAVVPSARGSGIGSKLLQRFIEDGSRAGIKKLHLEVRDGNEAVALYRRHDFNVEGRRPKYYKGSDGEVRDALTMVRLL